jgi:methionine-gamma-lyase
MNPHDRMDKTTLAIHGGHGADPLYGGVSMPIYQSSTFAFRNAEQGAARFGGTEDGYIYTRLGNPTIKALEDCVAQLEGGFAGLGTATGMAAVSTVFMTFLGAGDHMIGTAAVYGPSRTLMEREFARFGVRSDFVDTSRIEEIRARLTPATRLLFVESPANPTMAVTDLEACAALARERSLVLAVDNTFASPILQNPLALGADVVIHSLTKFINGHSDVVGGMIVSGRPEHHRGLRRVLRLTGGTMDPHQAWLVLRGVKTLGLRVEKSQDNARKIAEFLEGHPKVAWIKYPGLKSHPQYVLASRQMAGPGSLLSFGLKGGFEAGRRMINAVRLCTLAVSLGGIESLIQHPASMTHAGVPPAERREAGITDDLIRLSVGCEAWEDLRADLEQSLAQAEIP